MNEKNRQGAKRVVFLGLIALVAGSCDGMMSASKDEASGDESDVDWDDDADNDEIDGDDDFDDDDGDDDDDEEEEEAQYKVPGGSGRYVFIPDEANDTVVVVDSETLAIEVVDVGSRPTHLVPLGDDNAAMVLNLDSDEATIIRKNPGSQAVTVDLPVRADVNALVASADGRYVVAFHDPRFTGESGLPSTDQDISVLYTAPGREYAAHRIVGMHPWEVVFDDRVTRAFVITEGGISVVDLSSLQTDQIPDDIHLFEAGTFEPEDVDIEIVPNGNTIIARQDSDENVVAALLGTSVQKRSYTLPAVPTDLDIAEAGDFGLFVLRSSNQIALFNLPLPDDPAEDPFTYVNLNGPTVGVATLTPDGQHVLLHTTTGGDEDDQRRLTVLTRSGQSWLGNSVLLERKIRAVAPGADSGTAVVVHQEITPGQGDQPFSYSLVTLPDLKVKFQQIPVEPNQLLFTPEGDYGFMLLKAPQQVDILNLGTFIVDALFLGSPPTAAGYAAVTDKVFIAQDHPAGRMTFVGVHDGLVKTVTGYNLND